jgi:tRNA(Ile)-lysidine synthase
MRALNQQTDQHLVLLSLMADEEDRFMDGVAAAMLEQAEAPLNGELAFLTKDCELAFDRSFLAHMPFVTLRRALRMGVEALGADMEFFKTQGLAEDIVDGANGSVTCEGGKVEVVYDADSVHFRQVQPIEPYRFPLTVPGETLSDEFGWSFQAFPDSAPSKVDRSGLTTFVDPSKVKGALHFRTFQTGDEIVPLGFDHRRKLSDLLSEAKLSKAARGRLPIVCDMVGPIWIPGVCVSEKVRPQAGQSALCLRFGPIQSDSAT